MIQRKVEGLIFGKDGSTWYVYDPVSKACMDIVTEEEIEEWRNPDSWKLDRWETFKLKIQSLFNPL